MKNHQRYRIVTPDGRLSRDTFVIADQQPATLPGRLSAAYRRIRRTAGCGSRHAPVSAGGGGPCRRLTTRPACVCKECGKVDGMEGDGVKCPYGGSPRCGLVEPLEKEAKGLPVLLRFEVVEARHYRAAAPPPAQPTLLTGEMYR